MRNWRYLLLAFLLLGGQYALLAHAIDHLDQSHPEHACELCLHNAGIDSGIAPTIVSVAAPVQVEAPLPEYRSHVVVVVGRLFDARGPPVLFSA